ncbi:hypothetical protein FB45DRAFT_731006 [Roridomyces roridus]|uniref:SET domain-containing protein n=1 Tax=Roridomyces roridus TaxID=1738132 RepID=A0AAD7FZ97_9AGAR|nr:hypothetical protein FB45DRAFT_731006 [Roridomyces roridus]
MHPSRRYPQAPDAGTLLRIVRRLVQADGQRRISIRHAIDELLALPSVRTYLKACKQNQIDAFATHASRYFGLYDSRGSIELAPTSRYTNPNNDLKSKSRSEIRVLATCTLLPGYTIPELKGSVAELTPDSADEVDFKRTESLRDFSSVIRSSKTGKEHLFLGPARFVNHDCSNNCELFWGQGKYIGVRVLRPIVPGEEITVNYGAGYFGVDNRNCLCETCEKEGRRGYVDAATAEDADDEMKVVFVAAENLPSCRIPGCPAACLTLDLDSERGRMVLRPRESLVATAAQVGTGGAAIDSGRRAVTVCSTCSEEELGCPRCGACASTQNMTIFMLNSLKSLDARAI